ncbi:Coiled-coil and C2 domain-containing protein 1-like [Sarcoptes scabiei]|nr:Coiled-coil and C2 domain-containing protein 1-like [Sarcoptes scabiei]
MDPNIKKLLEDNFDSPEGDDDDDIDEDGLEDELENILEGKAKPAKKLQSKSSGKSNVTNGKIPPGHGEDDGEGSAAFDLNNIHNLMKNLDADEGDDDDEEVDENDPELLSELSSVLKNPISPSKKPIPPAKIQEIPTRASEVENDDAEIDEGPSEKELNIQKIKNLQIEYKRAALKAKTNNDKNAALTYLKVSKQLDSMLNALDSGEDVDMKQLPPKPEQLQIAPPMPEAPEGEIDPSLALNQDDAKKLFNAPTSASSVLEALEQRLKKFQSTKEQAESENNANKARRLGRIITQMQKAIKDHKAGKPVNFDELPCPPGFPPIPVENKVSAPNPAPVVPKRPAPVLPLKKAEPQTSDEPASDQIPDENDPSLALNQDDAKKLFNAPESAGSILEALEQRLAKFKSTKEQAVASNNANKARRLGRIVTQMEKAIKDHKAGKPVDFDELPCPPGFPPIPVENKGPVTASKQKSAAPSQPKPSQGAARPPLKKQMSTTVTKQLNYLLQRQKLFREAAMDAKKRGEIEQAKEYLRSAKGFDALIEATKSGLPIDATSIPTPPQLSEDFLVVSQDENADEGDEDDRKLSLTNSSLFDVEREELFTNVAQELKKQIEMCIRNREYFLKMGDIPTSSKFEKYASESKQDLHMLLIRKKNGDAIPSYRVETRTFSIVVANLDVPLNELHVEVIRAFDFSGTPEIDTYVRADFPFPSESPQWKKTKTFYDSLTPEYNDTLFFQIDRKSRSLPRILKRHPLKLSVYAKGGFLRSDNLIGTILIKLSDLETKCTIHECSSWTQGRKVINGKLEVKVKIREPLLAKQVEEIKEKWIVFS